MSVARELAQPKRMDRDVAAGVVDELGCRIAARPGMKLQAESFWLATQAVDMRTGIDGLSLHVQQALGRAPCDGTAYVFSNRRRTRLKLVCWDGDGVWMCLRRLSPRHWQAQRDSHRRWRRPAIGFLAIKNLFHYRKNPYRGVVKHAGICSPYFFANLMFAARQFNAAEPLLSLLAPKDEKSGNKPSEQLADA